MAEQDWDQKMLSNVLNESFPRQHGCDEFFLALERAGRKVFKGLPSGYVAK